MIGGAYRSKVYAAWRGTTGRPVEQTLRERLAQQAAREAQADILGRENDKLRKLLDLREQMQLKSTSAEIIYETADPYTRKIIIDKGLAQGVEEGSPVIDESGVLGQVTRVLPPERDYSVLQRSLGGACVDSDGDGVCDKDDNCPSVPNPNQNPDACQITCDVNLDGKVTQADLTLIRAKNGQLAGANDPYDPNKDGKINVADVRYCQLRLTPP